MRLIALALLVTCCREQTSAPPPAPSTTAMAVATASPQPEPLPKYDTSCKKDWDCTPAPSCCPIPCSSYVINARELERARAALQCDPAEHCPVAGGCQTFAYLCLENSCKIVFSNEPGFRKREVAP